MGFEVNSVTLSGKVAKDAESRRAGTTVVAGMRLQTWGAGPKGGDGKNQSMFVTVEFWEKKADDAVQQLKKGVRVIVTGRLKMNEWTQQDGSKRTEILITASDYVLMDPPNRGAAGGGSTGVPPQYAPPDVSEDIPF